MFDTLPSSVALMIPDCWISRLALIFHYFPAGRYLFILLAQSGTVGNCWIWGPGDQNNQTENILLQPRLTDIHPWLWCWWHFAPDSWTTATTLAASQLLKMPGGSDWWGILLEHSTQDTPLSPPVWREHGSTTEEIEGVYWVLSVNINTG